MITSNYTWKRKIVRLFQVKSFLLFFLSSLLVFLFLLLFTSTSTFTTLYSSNSGDNEDNVILSNEELLANKVVELAERIKHAEMMNQERRRDILRLQHILLNNNSSQSSSHVIQVPSITSFLPHLLRVKSSNQDPLKPAFVRRSSSSPSIDSHKTIVFGIPTVKRPVESYLLPTIANLIENMSPDEMKVTLIVVLVAESADMDFVRQQTSSIESRYEEYIESGLIEVIAPPATFYPDLDKEVVVRTLGDPLVRVKWRTKQNLDFSYLMMYCQSRGTYYVQLEDDVLSKPSFVSKMVAYAAKQSAKPWIILDFCQLGFIGKMFKSTDLSLFAMFFIMFHSDKPVDWLLTDVLTTKLCSIDKTGKECRKTVAQHWISFRPSLFQHIGTHSSLAGKVQKLKDKNFGKLQLFKPHADNPPAKCHTSLHVYKPGFSPQNLWEGKSLFWSFSPSIHDHVTCDFKVPIDLDSWFIRSGNSEHPEDVFPLNTTFEVKPVINLFNESFTHISNSNSSNNLMIKTDDGYFVVGLFKGNGICEGNFTTNNSETLIKSIRINLRSDSQKWAMISEMQVKVRKKRKKKVA